MYASHHLSGLKLIKARGLGDVSHKIIHPTAQSLPPSSPPPLTHQGYSVSPQRPLIALFFTPQLQSALSFIHFSQCWRSLTHISIISCFFFPLGGSFSLNVCCCWVFVLFFQWVGGWVGVRRASRGKEGVWLRQCQGGLFFN